MQGWATISQAKHQQQNNKEAQSTLCQTKTHKGAWEEKKGKNNNTATT
jgi:hypothetical protein